MAQPLRRLITSDCLVTSASLVVRLVGGIEHQTIFVQLVHYYTEHPTGIRPIDPFCMFGLYCS